MYYRCFYYLFSFHSSEHVKNKNKNKSYGSQEMHIFVTNQLKRMTGHSAEETPLKRFASLDCSLADFFVGLRRKTSSNSFTLLNYSIEIFSKLRYTPVFLELCEPIHGVIISHKGTETVKVENIDTDCKQRT